MNDYKITITETLKHTVIISAETEEEAVNQVKDMLDMGQIILVAEDFFDREIEPESV